MREKDWLACNDIHSLLRFVQGKPVGFLTWVGWRKQPLVQAGERRLRLFACACCRRIARLFTDRRLLQSIDAVEEYADGHMEMKDLEAVITTVEQVYQESCEPTDPHRYSSAFDAVSTLVRWKPVDIPDYGTFSPELMTVNQVGHAVCREGWQLRQSRMNKLAESQEYQAQCHLLRDIFGNPFRPVKLHAEWQTPTVLALANAAYQTRTLPAGLLDWDRLAILADALEDAGCDNPDILNHLRQSGVHVRGCWVVDLVRSID